jgi:hypothetical protein
MRKNLGCIAIILTSVSLLVAQTKPNLIYPSDFKYLGAFRLEEIWGPDNHTWEYSNGPLAYYPNGDPAGSADGFPGSLFMAGHVYSSLVAELSIPKPIISKSLNALPVAKTLQPMVSVTDSLQNTNGFILGMTYVPAQDRVFFTYGQDYSASNCDQAGAPPGLGSFKPTLNSAQAQGLWFLGTLSPFQSLRYIAEIPSLYSSQIGGLEISSGRHRGWCPEGTNFYASAPWLNGNPPAPNAKLSYQKLMEFGGYDAPSSWSKEHSPANAYQGVAWLTKGTRAAVAISGLIDYDPSRSYYGYSNWMSASQCDPNPASVPGCLDTGGRGWRAADPHAALLLFDPADFVAVANGKKAPGTVQWYAKFDMTPYMLRTYYPTELTTSADAEDILCTFDRARGLLYVSESFVDGNKPIIHVFQIQLTGVPAAPANLRIK